jgi:hypothetical protein
MSFRKSFLVAAASLILGAAGMAQAQTCASDKDCPQGYTCHADTVVAPTPGCKPGAECGHEDAGAPVVVSSCVPKSCSADTDCGAGMVCHEEKSVACSGGTAVAPPACPSDHPCSLDAGAAPPKPPEEMCTTTIVKMCAFNWQLPCNMDSDCGTGFTCKPTVSGSCSGSAGTGTATPGTSGGSGSGGSSGSSGGAARPAPFAPPSDAGAASPPMCTTMTSYPGYCAPTVTTCTADGDCPTNWKCTEGYNTPVASDPPPGSSAPVAPPRMDAGAPPPKMCTSTLAGGPARDSKGEVGAPGMGTSGGSNAGGSQPPLAPPGAVADAGAALATTKSSGCALGAGAGSSSLGLVMVGMLGVALLRRRRR